MISSVTVVASSLASELAAECLREVSGHASIMYGVIGSLTALATVQGTPAVLTAIASGAQLEITKTRLLGLFLLLLFFAVIGAVAVLFASPTSSKDAIAWGVGAEGLFLGLTRGLNASVARTLHRDQKEQG